MANTELKTYTQEERPDFEPGFKNEVMKNFALALEQKSSWYGMTVSYRPGESFDATEYAKKANRLLQTSGITDYHVVAGGLITDIPHEASQLHPFIVKGECPKDKKILTKFGLV